MLSCVRLSHFSKVTYLLIPFQKTCTVTPELKWYCWCWISKRNLWCLVMKMNDNNIRLPVTRNPEVYLLQVNVQGNFRDDSLRPKSLTSRFMSGPRTSILSIMTFNDLSQGQLLWQNEERFRGYIKLWLWSFSRNSLPISDNPHTP